MDPIASFHPSPKAWLVGSSFAPHLDAFVVYLKQGRYAANSTQRRVTGIAHCAR